jgi:hypothetical protein
MRNIASLNLNDNDVGAEFFNIMMNKVDSLQYLSMANTKITNRSIIDFSIMMKETKMILIHLDLS